jgi:hypothetical protein
MTHFAELVHNVRAQSAIDGTLSKLALVAKLARFGDVKNILPIINKRLAVDRDDAIARAHENAVWICPTHDRIQDINDAFLDKFILEGRHITRLVSVHCGTRKHLLPTLPFAICCTKKGDLSAEKVRAQE